MNAMRRQEIYLDCLYSIFELTQMGISENAIGMARKNGLPVYRFGQARLVLGSDIVEYLKRNRRERKQKI